MAATPAPRAGTNVGASMTDRRQATETRASFKTSEFIAMVVIIVAILISAAVIKGGDSGGTDEFIARQAWLYVSIVAGSYFISRGLAKSGSKEPYWTDGTNEHRDFDGR